LLRFISFIFSDFYYIIETGFFVPDFAAKLDIIHMNKSIFLKDTVFLIGLNKTNMKILNR